MPCDVDSYAACPLVCRGISKPSIWTVCMNDCQDAACPGGLPYPLCDFENCSFNAPCLRVGSFDCSDFASGPSEPCEVYDTLRVIGQPPFNPSEFAGYLDRGFSDVYPALILIFAIFCMIRLIYWIK